MTDEGWPAERALAQSARKSITICAWLPQGKDEYSRTTRQEWYMVQPGLWRPVRIGPNGSAVCLYQIVFLPPLPPEARFLSRERNRGKSAAGLRPCTPGRRALKRRGQRRGGEKADGICASVPLTILRATLVCLSGCPSPHRRRHSTYPTGGCIPAHVTWSRCFVQNSRPPSCVSRWGSKGAEPLSPSGRDSKGDRLGIGPLWRLSFSDFFPRRKEIGPPEASSD